MDHTTLTAEQYARVVARLTEQRDYLYKLKERMRANRFPADDPLYAAVAKAWEAASHACVAACGCRNRVHGPPPPPPPPPRCSGSNAGRRPLAAGPRAGG